MTYREKRLARAKRLREWAEKRQQKARQVFAEAEQYRGDYAFNTQPGHIPERARLIAREDRAFESLAKAHDMASRAGTIDSQVDAAVYDDDTDAVGRLRERITKRETELIETKRINALWRKGGASALRAAGIPEEEVKRHESTMRLCQWLKSPLSTTGIAASIRKDKERIVRLEREAVEGPPWRYYSAAEYGGTCAICGQEVRVGETILYRKPEVKHYACRVEEG